ncbi:MAG: hypothetical protein JW876_12160 [Candidatus Krumholzibacteriota bacterium]|nr:hypothetical protein [Candidatus Krumholzibacteriota bacterium]
MRLPRTSAAAILLVICAAATARAGGTWRRDIDPERDLPLRREIVVGPGGRVDLGAAFIVPGSDSLVLDGRTLVRGEEYRINHLRGTVILVEPVEAGGRLTAWFSRYPFPYGPVFAARFPSGETGIPARAVTLAATAPERETSRHRLRVSGSKTVGFDVGSGKGLGIDQSLRVSVSGRIAKDLEVEAFLTDDDLPVQPEGNTEELKHLDRVTIAVRSRHATVRLGDFTDGLDWSRFSSYDRELRGAHAVVAAEAASVYAGGGITKGRFETTSFRGREGVQGPYELLSARRFNGVIILPGTERVWLDGRELRRGSENDYTIDYNRGTVTFTEKVTVTADAEIVIDYQTGEDEYERTTITAGAAAATRDSSLVLRAALFRESDDGEKPVRGGLDDDERAVLAAAGDDETLAVADGVTPVEPGTGDYVLLPADSLPSRYVWIGTGGDVRLAFYEVAAGEGDYRTDGFTPRGEIRYAWAGAGEGNYRIGRPLPLPERREVVVIGASARRGRLFAGIEGDVSRRDRNILSSLGDEDNTGGALFAEGGISRAPLGPGRLTLRGEFSSLESRFVSPDKPREGYFYRLWNLEDAPLAGRERIGGGFVRYEGIRDWLLAGSWQRLSREGGLTARRADAEVSAGKARERGFRLLFHDSRTGGGRDRRFASGEGALGFGWIVPRIAVESERYRAFSVSVPDTGRFYVEGVVAVAARGAGPFRGELSWTRRVTDGLEEEETGWFRDRENDDIRFDGGWSAGRRIVDLTVSRRRTRAERSGAESWNDLARVRWRDAWTAAGLVSDIGYRITSGEERRIEKAVVFVGENQGDYDVEGREVGQKRGDYMVLYLPGEGREAVRSVEFTWRTSIGSGVRGLRGAGAGEGFVARIRRNVSLDAVLSVLERSRTDDLRGLYLLSPETLQRDDATLYGSVRLRQEWSFLDGVKRWNLKLLWTREDEEDNRTEGVNAERFLRDVRLRVETVPRPAFTVGADIATKLSERSSPAAGDGDYRVESLLASSTASWMARPSTRLSMELGWERRRDEVSLAEQDSWSGAPSFNAVIGSRTSLQALLRFTWTASAAEAGKPLFFLEDGLREDWNVIGQYRISRNVSFGLNYNGRREKDYTGEVKTVHALKMESRAYF